MTLLGVGTVAAVAPSYQGILDVASTGAKGCWSLRACSAAARGTKAINLCDDTGANCADILTDATTGMLNAPGTLGTNNCNTSGTCRIAKVYDQSGALNCASSTACDLVQAVNASRPTLTWNCNNSLPCMMLTGTELLGTSNNFTAIAQTFSISAVGVRTVQGSVNSLFLNSTAQFGFLNSANSMRMAAGAGSSVGNVTDGSWHAFQSIFAGASSTLFCGGSAGTNCSNGGTSTTVNPSTGSLGGVAIAVGNSASGSTYEVSEIATWAADNTSVRSSLNSNQLTFWGPF
jgi:hypothetical protein